MSRHSKWSKIKHQKGTADVKRGGLFTKLSRALTIAGHDGANPQINFKLRLVIDQAKAAGMPKETVERAIARGAGTLKEGVEMFEEIYEGFAAGGVAVIIEAVTDNRNRTLQELKHLFSEYGGNLAGAGSVAWMFERRGVMRLLMETLPNPGAGIEAIELQLIDVGAEDITAEDEGLTIYTKPEELKAIEERVRTLGFLPEYVGLEWVPKEKISVKEDAKQKSETLEDALEERDDVTNYYTNRS